jgi:hypothetical protein
MKHHHRHVHGVSLVEALVALAVMAFGMLGLVGMQTSMRMNADIAKQRSEAVRIAQERIEIARGYTQLTGGSNSYASIASVAEDQTVTDYTTNTTYRWTATVPTPLSDPPLKAFSVRVTWTDRNDQPQAVELRTGIAGVAPELAGSLGVQGAGSPNAFVNGRNPVIPRDAVRQTDGTSRFTPPGGSDIGWVFNNVTGVITKLCDGSFATCEPFNGFLLSGFVRFDLNPPFDTEVPRAPSFPVQMRVNYTSPSPSGTVNCYVEQRTFYVAYYCAMPVTTSAPKRWSGTPELHGFNIASSVDDDDDDRFRVCRYTPEDNDAPAGGNAAHPRVYTDVSAGLTNQNYLIIRAGDDDDAYACPSDGPSDALNTNTWDHQPPRS